jgi:putative DNA primase/helicase
MSKEKDQLMKVLKWCLKSESDKHMKAALSLARSEVSIPILPRQMDPDPWLLNCPNGTLELRAGTLREHRRSDYITKSCPTPYTPAAAAPLWERFLGDIFLKREALIRYVQRLLGYCLTGDVSEDIFAIWYGSGSNGKSTLITTIMHVLGEDYVVKANRDLFLAKKQDNHPAQLARLHGKRLVFCIETNEGTRLDEALVKEATGGDAITARRMREDPWQFYPTHKCVLVTNHKPEIRGTDGGIWRRIRLIPFDAKFWKPELGETGPEELRANKDIEEELKKEFPGILAWMVRGCLDWQQHGMETPEVVKTATTAYKVEQDVLQRFLEDCCVVDTACAVRATPLYWCYTQWTRGQGEEPASQRRFGEALSERGMQRYTDNGTKYRGVGLKEIWLTRWEVATGIPQKAHGTTE